MQLYLAARVWVYTYFVRLKGFFGIIFIGLFSTKSRGIKLFRHSNDTDEQPTIPVPLLSRPHIDPKWMITIFKKNQVNILRELFHMREVLQVQR